MHLSVVDAAEWLLLRIIYNQMFKVTHTIKKKEEKYDTDENRSFYIPNKIT